MSFALNFCFAIFLSGALYAQSTGLSKERQEHLKTLQSLIKEDRIVELATKWVSYPIRRPNPVPDIKNVDEFILYYDRLFDSAFKAQLVSTIFDSTNTIDFDHTYKEVFGLYAGAIWLDLEGKIITINHNSPADSLLQYNLHKEQERTVHPSVKPWVRNVLVWESEKHLIRVDEIKDYKYRYVAWTKPKTISEKPDLMLFDGVIERQGTMGGWTYTFKNKDWTYLLDDSRIAESEDLVGFFIKVFHKDQLKSASRCTEVK